ncbi:MAG: hypothetical protein AAF086_03895 [Planctomycetota bacterium]
MVEILKTIGLGIAVAGLAVEGLAILAMSYYAIRRRLPNPFVLQTLGFFLFATGAVLAVSAAAWLKSIQEIASP